MVLSNYKGEEVISNLIIKGGKKYEEREYIKRTVFNDPEGKDAFIIGNGKSRLSFDLENLYRIPSDIYGCNALYRDFEPTFLIVVDRHMYQEVLSSGYIDKAIVYTNHGNIKRYGGRSSLIPHNPFKGAGPTALHIAIEDGHTNIFLLGLDCAVDGSNNNVYTNTPCYNTDQTVIHVTVWAKQILEIIKNNPNIKFTIVGGEVPEEFLKCPNIFLMNYVELNTYITQHEQKTQ